MERNRAQLVQQVQAAVNAANARTLQQYGLNLNKDTFVAARDFFMDAFRGEITARLGNGWFASAGSRFAYGSNFRAGLFSANAQLGTDLGTLGNYAKLSIGVSDGNLLRSGLAINAEFNLDNGTVKIDTPSVHSTEIKLGVYKLKLDIQITNKGQIVLSSNLQGNGGVPLPQAQAYVVIGNANVIVDKMILPAVAARLGVTVSDRYKDMLVVAFMKNAIDGRLFDAVSLLVSKAVELQPGPVRALRYPRVFESGATVIRSSHGGGAVRFRDGNTFVVYKYGADASRELRSRTVVVGTHSVGGALGSQIETQTLLNLDGEVISRVAKKTNLNTYAVSFDFDGDLSNDFGNGYLPKAPGAPDGPYEERLRRYNDSITEDGWIPEGDADADSESAKRTNDDGGLSQFGLTFGSILGRQMFKTSPVAALVSGAIIGTIGYNVGQMISAQNGVSVNVYSDSGTISHTSTVSKDVWLDFTNDLKTFTAGAAIGAVSSYLTMEMGQALGLKGFGAELFSVGAGGLLGNVLSNLASNLPSLARLNTGIKIFAGGSLNIGGIGDILKGSFVSYFATKLAAMVVAPKTEAAMVLSSLGAAAGSLGIPAGKLAGGFIAKGASWAAGKLGLQFISTALKAIPGVGIFIGFVVGALIGNLFGKKKQRIPSAFADTILNTSANRFELGTTSVSNGGNIELARNMATITQETLNGVIETIGAGQKLRSVWSGSQGSLTARFGHTNDQLWVNMGNAGNTNVASADEAVDKAVLWALPNLKITGGNMFLKRAVARSQATSVAVLSGDMQIAEDYGFYLQNRAVIDAAIAEPYTSMKLATTDYLAWMRAYSWEMDAYKNDPANADPQAKDLAKMRAWAERKVAAYGTNGTWVHGVYAVAANVDSNFYDANKAFMTRALAKDSVALNATDQAFYNANQTQVDRITSRLALTQFAASWIITLQRAAELKINQASASDFFGGAQGFGDSLKLMSSAGDAPDFYDDLQMTMQADGTTLRAEYLSGGSNRIRGADLSRGDAFVHTWSDGGSGAGVTRSVQTIDGERALVLNGVGAPNPAGVTYSGMHAFNGGDRSDGWYSAQAGQRIGFGMETFAATAGTRADVYIGYWNASGVHLSWEYVGSSDHTVLGWQKFSGVGTAPPGTAYAAAVFHAVRIGSHVGVPQTTTVRRFQFETLPAGATTVSDWSGSSYDSFDVSNFWADVGYNQSANWSQPNASTWDINTGVNANSNQFFDFSTWGSNLSAIIKDKFVDPATGVTYSGGDDIFKTGAGNDLLEGWVGNDWLDAGAGNDAVYGNTGDDVLLGRVGNDSLYGGQQNDYVSGGEGDDTLYGNLGDDTVVGGVGVDSVFGDGGNDVLIADEDGKTNTYDGGAGSDTISFVKFAAALNYDLNVRVSGAWRGVFGHGNFINIENITGTNLNDIIWGDEIANILKGGYGDDQLYGRQGDDVLEGGSGADKLDGQEGSDSVSYESSQAAVWVDLTATAENLWAGEGFGGDAEGDTYFNIEKILGSALSDTLKGHSAYNLLTGGRGDDWFVATLGGDLYEGGEGFDTADFADFKIWDIYGAYVDLGTNFSAWAASGMTFTGIEHLSGSAFIDQFFGSAGDETFSGQKGNDIIDGRAGNDTYVFNTGDGYDTLVDDNVGSNALVFGEGVNWSMLTFNAANQGLQMSIRGTSDGLTLAGNFAANANNIIKTIDVGGSGGVEIGQINHGRSGNLWGEVIYGNTNANDWNWGYEGDDIIYGSGNQGYTGSSAAFEQSDNIIVGGEGNDLIYTSAGDDTFVFERGHGIDAIYDTGGRDRIVIGSTATMEDVIYKVVGSDLWVGLKDLTNSALEAHQVGDRIQIINGAIKTWDGNFYGRLVEHVAAGGAEIDFTKLDLPWAYQQPPPGGGGGGGGNLPPIVLDLGDDGVDLVGVNDSQVNWKDDATGKIFRVGWVDGDDGILALDRDGDGAITKLSEISFTRDLAGAKTDLEGLRAFDTNKDGVFDAKDTRFGDFKVWRDVNQNGRGNGKELQSLKEIGITSIDLKLTPTGFDGTNTSDSTVVNTASFKWADGRTGTANDVFLKMQWAHVKGDSAGAGALDLKGVGNEGEFGRVTGKDGKDAKKAVDFGKAIPTQDLDFIKLDTGDGKEALKKVVKKLRTFTDLADAKKSGASAGTASPLVIDLGGDGIELVEADKSSVWFDLNQDGMSDRLGWAGKGEGILALDRDLDGLVQPLSEISFTGDLPGATTDLEGLKAFDSNNDDWLSAEDARFGAFMIWTDADQNGKSSYEELMTLDQAGIAKIGLIYVDGPMRAKAAASVTSSATTTEVPTSDMPATRMSLRDDATIEASGITTAQVSAVQQVDAMSVASAATTAASIAEDLANTKNKIFGHAEVHFKDGRIVRAADAAFGSINGLSIDPLASSAQVAKIASTNPYEALDFGQAWSMNASQRRQMMEGLRDQGGPPAGFDDFMFGDEGSDYDQASSRAPSASLDGGDGASLLDGANSRSDASPGTLATITPASDVFAAITSARSLSGLQDTLADNDASRTEQTPATTRAIKRWWTDPAAGVQAFRSTLAGKGDTLPNLAALASEGTPANQQASGALLSSADAAAARQNQAFAQAITQFKSPSRMSGSTNRSPSDTNNTSLAPNHYSGSGLSKSRSIATNWG